MKIPRIMLAAPSSGSGKTLLTCALIGALKEKNMDVVSCKCGPDYIDPMFHRQVLQIVSENLDTFFTGEEETRKLVCNVSEGHDVLVMEGVMGLFDGLGGCEEEGSSYHLAKVTKTPIILVMDVHGMARTMIPVIKGILDYDTEKLIKGIVLNRITKGFYETIRPLLEEEIPVPVIGIFENHKDLHLESRHLGLCMPKEIAGIEEQLKKASAYLAETVNLDEVIHIARDAAELADSALDLKKNESDGNMARADLYSTSACEDFVGCDSKWERPRLAIARDEAFCFYYEANIRMLEMYGIEPVYFSPLHDRELPENIAGILLGGGYPENYAKELSENVSMRNSIQTAIENGLPSVAECGGFLYLHRELIVDGKSFPMVGSIDGSAENKGKLVRFGYVKIAEKKPVFLPEGETVKGHEFHYYDSTANGNDCVAVKPNTKKSWECIHASDSHWWGFAHLYWPSNPKFVKIIKKMMEAHQE